MPWPASLNRAGAVLSGSSRSAPAWERADYILPRLPDSVAEYRFTDISTFFLRHAKEEYGQYDFMSYGLLDINSECAGQDIEVGAYDVIVCANVLHNSVNIDDGLHQIEPAAKPRRGHRAGRVP